MFGGLNISNPILLWARSWQLEKRWQEAPRTIVIG